jgi:hypothetical protein
MISILYANIMGNYSFDLERKNMTMMRIHESDRVKMPYMKPEDPEDVTFEEVNKEI